MKDEKVDLRKSDALRDEVIRRMVNTAPEQKPKATARQNARKAQASGSSDAKKGNQG